MRGKKRRSPARKDRLLRRFAHAVGEDEMAEVLIYAADPRAHRLMAMLCDPAYQCHSFAKLSERAGLSLVDLLELFRRYKLDMGIVSMSRKAVQVMEDTAEDARSKMETCKGCQGKGLIDTRRCPQCEGEGQVRVPGDYRARKLMFQTLGLIGK